MHHVCLSVLAVVSASVVLGDLTPSPVPPSANSNTHLWNATWTDRLRHDLLMKYDKFARPDQHSNRTEVEFFLMIQYVEVDEGRSLMVMNTYTVLEWNDDKLKWNASDYGGIKSLHVADHEIWQPDIVLYNSALGNSVDHYGNVYCTVSPSGHVKWVPPSQFSVHCDINLRKWPYDRHTCTFFFGSWVYDGEQVYLKRMRKDNETFEISLNLEPMQWRLVSAKEMEHEKYYPCCSEPYYVIEAVITVERKSPWYGAVTFTPALVCMILTLAVFWLPAHASERFLLSGVAAVLECMFLLYFAQKLPSMGPQTPLIVEFYGYSLILVSLSVVVSVVTVNLSRRPAGHPVPWFISRTLDQYAGFLGLANPKSIDLSYGRHDCEEMHERSLVDRTRTESVDTTQQPTSAHRAREWLLLANAIDRLMFVVYILIFLLIGAAFYIS